MTAADGADAAGGGRYGEAVFRPDQGGEGERIDFGALAYDDITVARLKALGVGPGWRCLDVGAGTGTVSLRLLQECGVTSVVAVDRDARFLTARRVPGLDVREADVTAAGFVSGRFRLVHARFVLMHLPEYRRMIADLAALVEPGGVLVLSDAVDLTGDRTPTTPYTTAMTAMWQGLRDTIGTDVTWVPSYPHLLREAGLGAVAAEVHVPPLVPGSALSRFWADTWERSRPYHARHRTGRHGGRRRGGPLPRLAGLCRTVGRDAHRVGVEAPGGPSLSPAGAGVSAARPAPRCPGPRPRTSSPGRAPRPCGACGAGGS